LRVLEFILLRRTPLEKRLSGAFACTTDIVLNP
jgi:hypothetical protein